MTSQHLDGNIFRELRKYKLLQEHKHEGIDENDKHNKNL